MNKKCFGYICNGSKETHIPCKKYYSIAADGTCYNFLRAKYIKRQIENKRSVRPHEREMNDKAIALKKESRRFNLEDRTE